MTSRKQIESLAAILLALLLIGRWQRSWTYVAVAGGLLLLCLVWPGCARWVSVAWMKFGKAMGAVTGRVLLTVVYLLIVIPMGFVARWRGKLHIRLKPRGQTNFEQRDHLYSEADFSNPW
jgi:hypothetical protein